MLGSRRFPVNQIFETIRSFSTTLACGLLLLASVLFVGCSGSVGEPGSGKIKPEGNAQLTGVHYGRLVDVYGLRKSSFGVDLALYRSDVIVGPDIQDERSGSSNKRDEEIEFDFINADPDTLQPRLLITRQIDTPEFDELLVKTQRNLRRVTPGVFGQNTTRSPHSVVPRNAGIQLTFSRGLDLTDDFFVSRDPLTGRVKGVKNSEAVQLLEIIGDPTGGRNAFRMIKSRISVRENVLMIDPVLLGTEGIQYGTRNNAAGMPESPDQVGANIRIALALEGPLAVKGFRQNSVGGLAGLNGSGLNSIIRDFRSGNSKDSNSDISKGFARDPIPPRIIGEILTFLARVDDVSEEAQQLWIYKNGIEHEIDRGDVIRVAVDNTSTPVRAEVIADPEMDQGKPGVQHVLVTVRRTKGLEAMDPSNNPGYPPNPGLKPLPEEYIKELEGWLVKNGPRAVVVAEFTSERRDPDTGKFYGDDPRHFLTFTPEPLPFANGNPSPPNENVSPFANAIIRFTKPVDLLTVKGLDSYFFGTRNLLDAKEVDNFIADKSIDPPSFKHAKFLTPHLIFAQVYDEGGSQTALRLQPRMGFYLDEKMRQTDEGRPFEQKQFRYYIHLLGGKSGILDLSGNQLDFQSVRTIRDELVIPFSLDTRKNQTNTPLFSDNLSVTVVRRFADRDEDEQPSYYIADEVQKKGASTPNPFAYNLDDVFGGVVYLTDGRLSARPASRITRIVDDLNQQSPPPQNTNLRFCPETIGSEQQVASSTASVKFGQPIQNPLNPFGARLQTLWREIDMSLSRSDPYDFNLDVEQMYWAPFTGAPITFDEFDRLSLFLGHSEMRPEPCVGAFGALPTLASSGLWTAFADNMVQNYSPAVAKEPGPLPHPAYEDKTQRVDTNLTVMEPNQTNRFLPLPEFKKPYFVWRDEQVPFQGGNSNRGWDTATGRGGNFKPYIISPFLGGKGRYVTASGGRLQFNGGFWDNRRNYWIAQNARVDTASHGLVGTIALPLLADFWSYPDSPDLPKNNPFRASGANGWQIALAVQSAPTPSFRAYSGGGLVQGKPQTVNPSTESLAQGGYTPNGGRTRASDNSVYWMMTDFQKRVTVATAGFVEILNPHRVPQDHDDPRLGPYFGGDNLPLDILPKFEITFEPDLQLLPGGTKFVPEFRAAGVVDNDPWAAKENAYSPKPDRKNFALDPMKAGDAHIRKYDDRPQSGSPRNYWTYYYNKNVTDYTPEINQLMSPAFTNKFAGPNEAFLPKDVKYFNWRFVINSNVDASPPVSPSIDSFAVTYRFEKVR